MRISDWSSDVCSSDLSKPVLVMAGLGADPQENIGEVVERHAIAGVADFDGGCLGIQHVEAVTEILAILGRTAFSKHEDGWKWGGVGDREGKRTNTRDVSDSRR